MNKGHAEDVSHRFVTVHRVVTETLRVGLFYIHVELKVMLIYMDQDF